LLDGLSACAAQDRLNDALEGLSARELARLLDEWEFVARRDQWPPPLAANDAPWRTWLILGGRGAGKTRAGAEWVKALALGRANFRRGRSAASRLSARRRRMCAK
jgi:phage terminase large subunit-like protein